MKTIITTVLVILGYFGYSQTPNQIVAQYAKDHVGQQVGKGLCLDLVDSALSQLDTAWLQGSVWSEINDKGVVYGEEIFFITRGVGDSDVLGVDAVVNFDVLKEGDIVLFDDVVENGDTIDCHIGILIAGEDGDIMIAHQNVVQDGELIQKVIIEEISPYFYEKYEKITQKIRVFRPRASYETTFSKLLSKKYRLERVDGSIFLYW
jgi:hypothetical protein